MVHISLSHTPARKGCIYRSCTKLLGRKGFNATEFACAFYKAAAV